MDIPPSDEPPAEWLSAVERGRADLVAGRTVPIEAVLERLRAAYDRMTGERASAKVIVGNEPGQARE